MPPMVRQIRPLLPWAGLWFSSGEPSTYPLHSVLFGSSWRNIIIPATLASSVRGTSSPTRIPRTKTDSFSSSSAQSSSSATHYGLCNVGSRSKNMVSCFIFFNARTHTPVIVTAKTLFLTSLPCQRRSHSSKSLSSPNVVIMSTSSWA